MKNLKSIDDKHYCLYEELERKVIKYIMFFEERTDSFFAGQIPSVSPENQWKPKGSEQKE